MMVFLLEKPEYTIITFTEAPEFSNNWIALRLKMIMRPHQISKLLIAILVFIFWGSIVDMSSNAQTSSLHTFIEGVTWSPNGEQIAFVFGDSEGSNIWTVDINGFKLVNLTETITPSFNLNPQWSPDGESIVFSSDHIGNFDIWIVTLNDFALRNLTYSNLGDDRYPQWSPDGSRLAYIATRHGDMITDLWAINPNGSNQTKLTPEIHNAIFDSFDWSQNNQIVVEKATKTSGEIHTDGILLLNIDSRKSFTLTSEENDNDPIWSPEGDTVIFTRQTMVGYEAYFDVWSVDKDGKSLINLTSEYEGLNIEPTWHPNGGQIAFVSDRSSSVDIWIMEADGSDPINLTNSDHWDTQPIWSPNGEQIAFLSRQQGEINIWIMDSNGANKTNLTHNAIN